MKKLGKKVNKKINNQNQKSHLLHKNKNYAKKNNRKRKNNKILHTETLTQKNQQLPTKKKQLVLSKKLNKIIGIKTKEKFSIKVEKYFGPSNIIKNSQEAKQKVKQQISSLENITDNFNKIGLFFRDVSIWVLSDYDITNKQGQLDLNQMAKIRKVMFHMFEGTFMNLILETKLFSSLIMFSHVKLHNLRDITLKNTVISIQSLVWFDCPSLKSLTIQDSDVVNIKSLNKCNWKDLSFLRITQNKIPCSNFERIKIKKGSNLQVIGSLQPYQFRNSHSIHQSISVQDIRCLSRSQVQTTAIPKNFMLCSNRISQLKIIEKFISRSIIQWDDQMQDISLEDFDE